MNELMVAERATHWHRLKALVLDSVSSPITRRVYILFSRRSGGSDQEIFRLNPKSINLFPTHS